MVFSMPRSLSSLGANQLMGDLSGEAETTSGW